MARAIPKRAAVAAKNDHRELHAPKYREVSPNRDQGKIEHTRTQPNPIRASRFPRGGTGAGSCWGGGGSTSTVGRHSGPMTCPRTGTAHARHNARPHTSHRPTCAMDGWLAHLPGRAEVVFSSLATPIAYARRASSSA